MAPVEQPGIGGRPVKSGAHDLRRIRRLLTDAFTDAELRQLCYDTPSFRPVYEQFSTGMSKTDMIQRLLEFSERKGLLDELLALAQEEAPDRYAEFVGAVGAGDPHVMPAASSAQVEELINKNTRRLYLLQQKQATYGLNTPPEVVIEIEDLEKEIARLRQQLHD